MISQAPLQPSGHGSDGLGLVAGVFDVIDQGIDRLRLAVGARRDQSGADSGEVAEVVGLDVERRRKRVAGTGKLLGEVVLVLRLEAAGEDRQRLVLGDVVHALDVRDRGDLPAELVDLGLGRLLLRCEEDPQLDLVADLLVLVVGELQHGDQDPENEHRHADRDDGGETGGGAAAQRAKALGDEEEDPAHLSSGAPRRPSPHGRGRRTRASTPRRRTCRPTGRGRRGRRRGRSRGGASCRPSPGRG